MEENAVDYIYKQGVIKSNHISQERKTVQGRYRGVGINTIITKATKFGELSFWFSFC